MFIGVSLVNPSTGKNTIVDAKIDTGAVVSLFPMSSVSDMELDIIGEQELSMANGDILNAYICLCDVRLSDDDAFEMPIYVCKSKTDIALIGMDLLQQCDFSFTHEQTDVERYIRFVLTVP